MEPVHAPTPCSSALTTSESSDTDEVNSSSARVYFGPVRSPEKKLIARAVARRAAHKSGAFGTPVRRSPRLSPFRPPQPQSKRIKDASSSPNGVECLAECVDYDTSERPREETLDNDPLFDEPSSVLASKVMRAFDNPSPPPRRRMYPGTSYSPGKDGQFPVLDVSAPPSPFRSINLFERLSHLAAPIDDTASPPSSHSPSPSVHRDTGTRTLDASGMSQQDLISFETLPASYTMPPLQAGAASIPGVSLSTEQPVLHDFLSETPERPCHPTIPMGVGDEAQRMVPADRIAFDSLSAAIPSDSASGEPCPAQVPPKSPLQQPSVEDGVDSVLSPGNSELLSNKATMFSVESYTTADLGSLGGESVNTDGTLLTKTRRRDKQKQEEDDTSLRLGSLSPRSTDVLTQLLPSSHSATQEQSVPLPANSLQVLEPPTSCTSSASPRRPNLSRTTILRPAVASTPNQSKGVLQNASPLKFGPSLDDVARTPARRVPIRDVLANATPSFQKTAQLALMEDQSAPFSQTRGPIFSRPDGAPRRLAKRVPMVDSVLSPSHAAGISTKSVLRARSASAEPRPAVPSPSRSRSVEPSPRVARATVSGKAKEPTFPRLYTAAGIELPYPLVAKEKSHIGPIPEESEEANVRGTHLHTSVAPATPHKSQLKQPSVTSRIPRIGAKPYARPRPGVTTTSNTASVSKVHPANDSKPLATPQPHRESGHGSSDDLGNQSASVLASPNNSALKTLKRKRTPGVVAVQSNSRPLKIRQVVPGMFGGKYAAKLPQDHAPEPTATPLTSPQKPIMPVPFRKVVDGMLSARYGPSKSSTESGETHATLVPVSIPSEQVTDSTFHSSYSETPDPQHSPMSSPEHEASEPSAQVPAPIIASNEDESDTLQNENKSHSKKSSRARRHTSDASDVVGNTSRSTNTGRRPQSRADGDGFMGMSATALKALTSSNTAKNQQTVAIFATEVIRKEGLRPESPSVKIRTILQKQREEKDRERNERAERRARRSEEGCGDTDTEGENKPFGQTPGDGSHDEHESLIFTRHCRGLGDEEDYETPDGQRQNKLRVEEGEEGEEVKQTKQVKWHRGLSTSAYLDDVHPRSRTRPDTVVTKGCLAPSSKSLRLDALGNVVDIDSRSPLQLVQEHVVIKKYLYDNEVEPEPVPPPRTTRSRARQAKS